MIGAVRGNTHSGRPPYLAHFALREPPFSPAADPRFFYADPARQQCLDMLLHLAQYSEEWLLVAGEDGVGKSTLLAEFLARADEHLRPCRIDGHHAADGGQLFLRIAQCFGLDLSRATEANPLDALRQHLNARQTEQVPMVIVDDGDRLSDDALEIVLRLAELEGDHGKLVRVVLFGPTTLQHRLGMDRFAGLSQPHVMELRAFDEGHAGLYLAHRLSLAGYEGANPFDAKAVRRIHKNSGGIPGRINTLADEALREKMAAERSTGAGARVRRVLIPVAALAAVGFAGFLLQEQWVGVFGSPLSANESLPPMPPIPDATPPASARQAAVIPLPPVAEPTPHAARPLVLREGEAVQVTCSPLSGAQDPAATPAPKPAPLSTAAPAETVAPETREAPLVTPMAHSAAAATAPQPVILPLEKTTPAAATAPGTESPAAAVSGAEWLRGQDPQHFTLQLLAAGQERTVTEFMQRHRLEGPHAMVDTTHNGAPLHVLVYQSYPTKAAAMAAAKHLPQGIRAWPRPFRELQGEPKPSAAPATTSPQRKDSAWLWSRAPRHITVQLAGAEHEQALWNHLGKEPLTAPHAVFTTKHRGKLWYVLVYGDFADRETALKARAALPARLRQGEPWLREFAAIHALLGPRTPSQP